MRIIQRSTNRLKLAVILLFGVLMLAVFCVTDRQKAVASAQGPSPSHTNAPNEDNCTACHMDNPANSGTGSVQITGLPQTYQAGQQIPITVTTSQVGAVIYGFQLTALNQAGKTSGSFTIPAQSPVQIQAINSVVNGQNRQYIEHTVDGILPTQFDTKSWTFTWTAPSPAEGRIDFYASGNSANGDGTTSGDNIYTTTKGITPSAAASFSVSGRVLSSDGSRGLRSTTVVLTDAAGASRISTTSSFGLYSFSDVAAGQTYTLSVRSRLYRFANKNLTVSGDLANIDFLGLE